MVLMEAGRSVALVWDGEREVRHKPFIAAVDIWVRGRHPHYRLGVALYHHLPHRNPDNDSESPVNHSFYLSRLGLDVPHSRLHFFRSSFNVFSFSQSSQIPACTHCFPRPSSFVPKSWIFSYLINLRVFKLIIRGESNL